MNDQSKDQLNQLSTAELCGLYVKLRDAKKKAQDELDEKLKPAKEMMQAVEDRLLAHLSEQNIDSIATPYGTCYRKLFASYSVKDREAFVQWARQHDAEHVLDVRAAKSAVDEVVSETGDVPDGLARSAIFRVGIRRSPNQ